MLGTPEERALALALTRFAPAFGETVARLAPHRLCTLPLRARAGLHLVLRRLPGAARRRRRGDAREPARALRRHGPHTGDRARPARHRGAAAHVSRARAARPRVWIRGRRPIRMPAPGHRLPKGRSDATGAAFRRPPTRSRNAAGPASSGRDERRAGRASLAPSASESDSARERAAGGGVDADDTEAPLSGDATSRAAGRRLACRPPHRAAGTTPASSPPARARRSARRIPPCPPA